MTARKPAHPLIPADRVNGTEVVNKAGKKLGKIEDVAIEKVRARSPTRSCRSAACWASAPDTTRCPGGC